MVDEPIRVLIADDHTLLLDTLSELLAMEPDIEIAGTAGEGGQAVLLAARLRPDVVLLDVEMPGEGPVATVGRLLGSSPGSAVIVLSTHEGAQLVQSLLRAGARGYLHKRVSRQDLLSTIRGVHRDPRRVVVSVSERTFQDSSFGAAAPAAPNLSPRELEVLSLTARALSNRQIAARLVITEGTVKRHLRNIFGKLDAVSRIDAVNKAIEFSLITDPAARQPGLYSA